MYEFRRWLPSGSTLSKFLNIFVTLLVGDCAALQRDSPDSDGEVEDTPDHKQLREIRQAMWEAETCCAV